MGRGTAESARRHQRVSVEHRARAGQAARPGGRGAETERTRVDAGGDRVSGACHAPVAARDRATILGSSAARPRRGRSGHWRGSARAPHGSLHFGAPTLRTPRGPRCRRGRAIGGVPAGAAPLRHTGGYADAVGRHDRDARDQAAEHWRHRAGAGRRRACRISTCPKGGKARRSLWRQVRSSLRPTTVWRSCSPDHSE